MVKMIFRPLMLLMIVCGLGGYVFYLATGKFPVPGMSFTFNKSDNSPDLKRLTEMPQLNSIDVDEDAKDKIYKWQDENGVWHISNQSDDAVKQLNRSENE